MTDTDTTDTAKVRPGVLRRLIAAVGRGLPAIFQPAVIMSLAAVVAAVALVVVAVEQREQTDWQRRQTCLAWYQIQSTNALTVYLASRPTDISVQTSSAFFDDLNAYITKEEAISAAVCGGNASSVDEVDVPGADTSAEVDRQVQDLIDAYEAETGD